MSVASTFRTAAEFLLVVVGVSLLLGLVLGQPILFGFVETGSMEPTLSAGDGFVAIPDAIAGDVGAATEGARTTFRLICEAAQEVGRELESIQNAVSQDEHSLEHSAERLRTAIGSLCAG